MARSVACERVKWRGHHIHGKGRPHYKGILLLLPFPPSLLQRVNASPTTVSPFPVIASLDPARASQTRLAQTVTDVWTASICPILPVTLVACLAAATPVAPWQPHVTCGVASVPASLAWEAAHAQ